MLFAVIKMVLAHANANLNFMEIRMKAVGLNALLAPIVHRIELV